MKISELSISKINILKHYRYQSKLKINLPINKYIIKICHEEYNYRNYFRFFKSLTVQLLIYQNNQFTINIVLDHLFLKPTTLYYLNGLFEK